MLKFFFFITFLIFTLNLANAHFPVYSLYKERKPLDLFRALTNARQTKRRAGGFAENYELPLPQDYLKEVQFDM